jgi:hypothetical protein
LKLVCGLILSLFIISIIAQQPVVSENHDPSEKHSIVSSSFPRDDGDDRFSVKIITKGNRVYVDCFVKEYAFDKGSNKQQAKIRMYIDGKKLDDYQTAAFIVKDVPEGSHKVKIEIVDAAGEPSGLSKEFILHIDSII